MQTRYRKLALQRFWIPVQTRAADGGARPNSGGTPFRQPCPAYPSAFARKAPQVRFSEESFRTTLRVWKRISQKLHCESPRTLQKPHSIRAHKKAAAHSKPGMNSRNLSNIAREKKKRQPGFRDYRGREIFFREVRGPLSLRGWNGKALLSRLRKKGSKVDASWEERRLPRFRGHSV
jgi:hypothetical protein